MARASRVCPTPGCPNFQPCSRHVRPNANARGYGGAGHRSFRAAVLARNPNCVLCGARATVADHFPLSRRELIAEGLNPDDPNAGRGLCASCHGKHTAKEQPGGIDRW